MALSDIRAAIATALAAVPGVGVVNAWEPHVVREEDLRTFFVAPSLGYVLGWSITREATVETDDEEYGGVAEVDGAQDVFEDAAHRLVIRGYRAIDNKGATEESFQDLVEAIRDRLRQAMRAQYGDVTTQVEAPQVRVFEPREFAGVLVHYVELTQVCHEHLPVHEP